jgi:transposase-like protein
MRFSLCLIAHRWRVVAYDAVSERWRCKRCGKTLRVFHDLG